MRGAVTLFCMEQQRKTFAQTLPCGRELTITQDRDEAKRVNARGEIAVYDDRFTENPSFQILDSYRIRKNRVKREIIRAMIAYNEAQPSEPAWRRTEHALLIEWLEHNFAYRVGFLRSRAASVDLAKSPRLNVFSVFLSFLVQGNTFTLFFTFYSLKEIRPLFQVECSI